MKESKVERRMRVIISSARYSHMRQQEILIPGSSEMHWRCPLLLRLKQLHTNCRYLTENMVSEMSCDVLEHGLLPFSEDTVWETFVFQVDGAAVHRRNHTTDWMY